MIKKTGICLLILIHVCFLKSHAQQTILSGKVTDRTTGIPLPGVVVILTPGHYNAVTAIDGRYTMLADTGSRTVIVRMQGYKSQNKAIKIAAGLNTFDVALDTSVIQFGTVVVSASRYEQKLEEVTVSMNVIKPKYIENSNQTTVETAVESVPGVTVIDGQANIRGGSGFSYGAGSRVLVLVDDLPVQAADANDVKWSFIPIENIDQIEVVKGASSALYGSSALNGVINFRTAWPTDHPQTIITSYAGFYDRPADLHKKWWGNQTQTTSGIGISHRQKIKQFDLVLGAQLFNDDGYRLDETEYRQRINLNLRYHFKKLPGLTAGIAASTQKTRGGAFLIWDNDSTGALIPQGARDKSGNTLSIYTTYRTSVDPNIIYTGRHGTHKLTGHYFATRNLNNTSQGATSDLRYGEYQYRRIIGSILTLTGGIVFTGSNVKGDLYADSLGRKEIKRSDNLALYIQADWKYKHISLSAGYRNERARIAGVAVDPQDLLRFGGSYVLGKSTYIRSSYGQGFRFPSVAEKYIRTRVGQIIIYPNDSLQTERGWSAEIGIRQILKIKEWNILLDACRFWTEYRNMMEFTFGLYGNPNVDPLYGLGFKSKNIGNTRISGYEFTAGAEGNIGHVLSTLSVGFTYIEPVQLDFNPKNDTVLNTSNQNILKYRYRQMWKIDGEFSWKGITCGANVRYYSFIENIDRVFQDAIVGVKDFREKHNSGDWVVDARAGYALNRSITFSIIVKNVFNREYMGRPADLQPQRSYTGQLIIKI